MIRKRTDPFGAALTGLGRLSQRRLRSGTSPGFPSASAGLILALIVATLNGTDGRSEVIRVGVDRNLKPLSYLDDKGQLDGYTKNLFGHLARVTGLEFELVPAYWSLQMKGLKDGTIRAVANTMITEERRATMDFSLRHAYFHGIAYVRPEHAPIKKIAQLAGKKIAVLRGSIGESHGRENNNFGGQLIVCAKYSDVLDVVARGDADVAIGQLIGTASLRPELRTSFVEDLEFHFNIVVRKGDHRLLEQLNQGLLELHLNGTIDDLYRTWLGAVEPRQLRWADVRRYAVPIFFIFAAGIFFVTRQFYTQRLIRERLRIARDLHDELGNRLSELQMVTESAAMEQPARSPFLQEMRQRVIEAAQSVNDLVWVLRPEPDPWSQAGANLRRISRTYLDAAGVRSEIKIEVDEKMIDRPCGPHVRRAIFMATRELLRNAVRHARPDWVNIELEVTAVVVALSITDSGPGIELDDAIGERRGIFNLRLRVRELGGSFRFERKEAGFTVLVVLPLRWTPSVGQRERDC